jgi:hypothetical protein
MPEGSRAKVTFASEWAYGLESIGIIPPNATLKFDISLVKIESDETFPKIELVSIGDLQNYPVTG